MSAFDTDRYWFEIDMISVAASSTDAGICSAQLLNNPLARAPKADVPARVKDLSIHDHRRRLTKIEIRTAFPECRRLAGVAPSIALHSR